MLTCLLLFSFTAKSRYTDLIFGSKVFFFQTDSVQLKRDFKTNRRVFDAPDFLLNMPEFYNHIDSVLIVGAASPIGSTEHNYALSIARAKAMEVYIMWKHPDFDCGRIAEKVAGIDREGFRYLVAHDARVPDKGKILVLLNNTRNEELLLRGAWTWPDTRSPDYWSYRIRMLHLEGRYWWGERPQALTGFFTGVYGAVGTYDVRLFPKGGEPWGSLSNFSRSPEITGGYSKPLSRRWNLNFNPGIGYLGGEYNEYNHSSCADCYPKRSTKQRRYFGPMQAAVSLVYLIKK